MLVPEKKILYYDAFARTIEARRAKKVPKTTEMAGVMKVWLPAQTFAR